MNDFLSGQKHWSDSLFTDVATQWIQSLVLLGLLLFLRRFALKTISKIQQKFNLDSQRIRITHRLINAFSILLAFVFLTGIWGLDKSDLLFFVSSVLTVLGIAFFAQWSILSNITAGIILFFSHPIKIGQRIRIYDKEFDISGELLDISVFFLHVKNDEGKVITIPNNIALQKMMSVI